LFRPQAKLRRLFAGRIKGSLSGVMDTLSNCVTSAFQHDDPITHNAQGHEHSFIERM
jgi:hypothetical protein